MNIYRQKYRWVKNRLLIFGSRFVATPRDSLYSFVFWKECHRREKAKASWGYVITEYLAYECDGEQRRFIDLVFFRRRSVSYVSGEMNLSERICYAWADTVLSDLTGLAMQAGLTEIDLKKEIGSFRRHNVQNKRFEKRCGGNDFYGYDGNPLAKSAENLRTVENRLQ